jgi:hypothetical protein
MEAYAGILSRFTQEFAAVFCNKEVRIEWGQLVAFTSQMAQREAA